MPLLKYPHIIQLLLPVLVSLVTGSAQLRNCGFACQLHGNQCEINSLKPWGLCTCNGSFPLCWVFKCKITHTNLDKKELCTRAV